MDTLNSLPQLLKASWTEFVKALAAYLPDLVTALLLLLLGWLLARLLRRLVLSFGNGIDRLLSRLQPGKAGAALPLRKPASALVANGLYWLVILFFIAAAAEPLGLPGLSDWLGRFIAYLPELITGLLIIFAGYLLGGLVYDLIDAAARSRNLKQAAVLSRAGQLLVLVFAFVLGIGQLGLDISLLVNVVTLAFAAVLGGLALAFGLGASQQVGNILASQQLRKRYRVGQRVRVAELEGEILELTGSTVLLDTAQGRALVPARLFNEQVTLLLDGEQVDD
ncbi:mechanosensitive ion channel family protein [Marinobacterium arenosum]|uniref:mechanosensitive ion channel family protein n=1 Tax=Marinobacterium arenosum TaxID=2862496 RepID=UPI001C97F747|nr:mechanosensitive ion channel domain-containing protein [Marinobacterium arenosum]MBY4676089.1 mechanosensitive ion channel [Marinobacterium arenosum]